MSKNNKIAFHENEFQYKIDANLHKYKIYKNIYKTQRHRNNQVKIVNQPTHLMKRVKNKLQALQMMCAPTGGGTNKKDAPPSKQDVHFIIDHIMLIQHSIMQLTERLNRYSRLQLMFIFFQSFLSMIFNSYNLVMYFLRWMANWRVEFDLIKALLFYGYQIVSPFFEVVITVTGFALIYASIEKTPNVLHALIIYTKDVDLRLKLFQYATLIRANLRRYSVYGMYFLDGSFISATLSVTTTYIIILIQYGTPEFLTDLLNLNETQATTN